ncbi:hypothetical protein M1437_03580 [Patescibacteria group bacterium]|nr:hypothetical protein [Patescibacteria group bacterium]
MLTLKKLLFAPLFLVLFAALIYQVTPFLKSYDVIFSLSIATLVDLLVICALILISSLVFIIFTTVAQDWKIYLPVGLLASAIPLAFLPVALALIFSVGILVSLLLTCFFLDGILGSYLTFQPSVLLGPSAKHLATFLILIFCVIYFFQINKTITQEGFQIPDSLIDTALKVTSLNIPAEQAAIPQLPAIDPQQLNLLKQNPDLLKQYGVDPKMLDSLTTPQKNTTPINNSANNLIKQTIKDQIQVFIKPYVNFIPGTLAVLLFLTLQSLVSFMGFLIHPLLWLTFLILEKTGFTKYEVEMRETKKLVV